MSRLSRPEDSAKARIISSLFSQKSEDGARMPRSARSQLYKAANRTKVLESYITYIKVTEDAIQPSNAPAPGDDPNRRKQRYILVAVKRSGRVRMHKSRENANGTFSIGKTWSLDDLRQITDGDAVGFTVVLQKSYYWVADSPKEKDTFVAALVKIYQKFTGGRIPQLVGFERLAEGFGLTGDLASMNRTPLTSTTSSRPTSIPERRNASPNVMDSSSDLRTEHFDNSIAYNDEISSPVPAYRSTPELGYRSTASPVSVGALPKSNRQPLESDVSLQTSHLPPPPARYIADPVPDSPKSQRSQWSQRPRQLDTPPPAPQVLKKTPMSPDNYFASRDVRDVSNYRPRSRDTMDSTRDEEIRRDYPNRLSTPDFNGHSARSASPASLLSSRKAGPNAIVKIAAADSQARSESSLSQMNDIIEPTEEDIRKFLAKIDFSSAKHSDSLGEEIKREILNVGMGQLHKMSQNAHNIDSVVAKVDQAIYECTEFDSMLTLYAAELNTLEDSIHFIETQKNGLQIISSNERLLYSAIEQRVQNGVNQIAEADRSSH